MHWISREGWVGHLVAGVAGALTPLALAPFNYWPIGLISVALLYSGLRDLPARAGFWRGWWYGFGAFTVGTSWVFVSIHQYGSAPAPLAGFLTLLFVAGLALFFALFAWIWCKWLYREHKPLQSALAFAALWVTIEALRGWIFTGFPWLYLGYAQQAGPLAGLAPLGGVWLLSFAMVLTATLLLNMSVYISRWPQTCAALCLLIIMWGAGFWLRGYSWTTPGDTPLHVVAVQGNIEQGLKWNPQQLNAQLTLYRELTQSAPSADLYVWPETAVPVLKEYAEAYLGQMQRWAREHNAALITGLPLRQTDSQGQMRYYNGIQAFGQGDGLYLKQKLVPFGEYVPLQDLLRGLISFFDLPMSDFVPGPVGQAPLSALGYHIAPYICYEVIYPEFAADLAAQSELLLTVSNDAWFGSSIGPVQHLQMAQMRALESGRWMIRATNTGISALIDAHGTIQKVAPQFERTTLHGEVIPMRGLTPYLEWRSWPLAGVCTVLLLIAFLSSRRNSDRRIFTDD